MNRKEFLLKSTAGAAMLSIPGGLGASVFTQNISQTAGKTIQILHTNDQHSRIEPFAANAGRNAGKGGFARRAQLVSRLRKENPHTLLLDSGDVFQGTPYFNYFGGELEFTLMSHLKYDACTMGNHDFDNGLVGFNKALPLAKFPFLTSNYDFTNTILEGKTGDTLIKVVNGIRIGLFGLGIAFDGLVPKKLIGETRYLNPIEIAQDRVRQLQQKKCDLIICLSHLGYEYEKDPNKISDLKFAAQTSGIHAILGGHTHTFLPKPTIVSNKDGKEVLINQVGWAGLKLGKIDFTFGKNGKIQQIAWNNHLMDEEIYA